MSGFIQRRIGRRVGVGVGLVMAAAGIGGLLIVLGQTFRTQESISKELLGEVARTVAASFGTFDGRTGRHPAEDIAALLGEREALAHLEIFDDHGRVRWSTDARSRGVQVSVEVLELLGAPPEEGRELTTAREGEVQVVLPLRKTSACLPCHNQGPDPLGGVLVAANTHELLGDTVAFIWRAGAAVVLFAVALTALLLFQIHRVIVRRVELLARVMAKAEEGDYLVRAEVSGHDEIGLLTSTFNRMLAKITDLRVERIESDREMNRVKGELALEREVAQQRELLEATNTRLSEKNRELAFLNQVARDLSAKLDPDYMLTRFCEHIHASLHIPQVVVLLFDRHAGKVQAVKVHGFPEGAVTTSPFEVTRGLTGEVVRSRTAIYVPDMELDDRELIYRPGERALGSVYSIPMRYQDEVIGVLNLSSPERDAFSEEDRDLMDTVAAQAALALANARLFQETLALSNTDGLTGIMNRRAMDARFDLEWSRAMRDDTPISLLMIDIDHFKTYNDEHGHQLGDEALRRVARILDRSVRKVDAVARYGGEEFAVILPRAGKKEAVEVARKLRRNVEQSDFLRGFLQPLGRVTISCGVATAKEDAASVGSLVERADTALRAAKLAGRNRVFSADGSGGSVDAEGTSEPQNPAAGDPPGVT